MTSPKTRLIVLISGSGSNLQALIDKTRSDDLEAEIVAVISNNADAFGLQRATQAGIPTAVLDHRLFESREEFDTSLAELIDSYRPDWVFLAGFMRILTPEFVHHYLGRLINIHPSLLPKFPGLDTHQRAIEAGERLHGATVHFVIPELDAGPAIIQGKLAIVPGETASELASRVLSVEHEVYPATLQLLASGRATYAEGHALLDNEPLPPTGHQMDFTQGSDAQAG